jgi:hypothetical protein
MSAPLVKPIDIPFRAVSRRELRRLGCNPGDDRADQWLDRVVVWSLVGIAAACASVAVVAFECLK